MVTRALVDRIVSEYALALDGIHGLSHWARVLEIGRRLASQNDAHLQVVELFAVFHDSKRLADGHDPEHGLRGAQFAASLRGSLYDLDTHSFELLDTACTYHTDGLVDGDITVLTCWDADRLDLGRVGMRPDPRYLCTDAAKKEENIRWAYERGVDRVIPNLVQADWGRILNK